MEWQANDKAQNNEADAPAESCNNSVHSNGISSQQAAQYSKLSYLFVCLYVFDVSIYVCIYAHMCASIASLLGKQLNTPCRHVCMYAYIHTCMYPFAYLCVLIFICAHTYMCSTIMCMHVCRYMRVPRAPIYVLTYKRTPIYGLFIKYTHAHAHIYISMCSVGSECRCGCYSRPCAWGQRYWRE
jgi:hypothetical protein